MYIHNESCQIFVGILVWVLIIPFILAYLLLCSAWKIFVEIYIKIKYWKCDRFLLQQPNILETVYSCPNCDGCMIGYAFVGDDKIDLKRLREHFYNTFVKDGKDIRVRTGMYVCNIKTI